MVNSTMDFYELDTPRQTVNGWYVACTNDTTEYLHNDSQVHTGTQDGDYTTSGYFVTEYEAHQYAEHYYLIHCRKYPYKAVSNKSQHVNDGSQIMEFGN